MIQRLAVVTLLQQSPAPKTQQHKLHPFNAFRPQAVVLVPPNQRRHFLLEIKNIISSLSRQISNCLELWDVHDYQKNTFPKLGRDGLC